MEKITKDNVSDLVFYRLSQYIVSGEWSSGTKIPPEMELADQLGVSRASVRSAIQKLQAFGMVKTQAGEGTFVEHVGMSTYFRQLYSINAIPHSHQQINQVKSALEESCVKICIEKKQSAEKIKQLRKNLDRMVAALKKDDTELYLSEDILFHKTISEMTENDILIMIYNAILSLIFEESKWNTLQSKKKNKEKYIDLIFKLHNDVIDVLETQDIKKCEQIFAEQQAEANKLY